MKNKMTQIFVLCGLYFIISSFLGLLVGGINLLSALVFLLFLPGVVIITFFKSFSFVIKLKRKYPNLTLLLNILGAYVVVYFMLNLLGVLWTAEYGEWNELVVAMVDIIFFAILMLSLIFILVKKIKAMNFQTKA